MNEIHKLLGAAQALLESGAGTEKVLSQLIRALSLLAEQTEDTQNALEETNEYVSRMDEDLAQLELMHDDGFDGYDPDDDPDEPDETDGEEEKPEPDGKNGRTLTFRPRRKDR